MLQEFSYFKTKSLWCGYLKIFSRKDICYNYYKLLFKEFGCMDLLFLWILRVNWFKEGKFLFYNISVQTWNIFSVHTTRFKRCARRSGDLLCLESRLFTANKESIIKYIHILRKVKRKKYLDMYTISRSRPRALAHALNFGCPFIDDKKTTKARNKWCRNVEACCFCIQTLPLNQKLLWELRI